MSAYAIRSRFPCTFSAITRRISGGSTPVGPPPIHAVSPGARAQGASTGSERELGAADPSDRNPECEREIDRYRVTQGGERLALDERVIVRGPFDDCSFSAFFRAGD